MPKYLHSIDAYESMPATQAHMHKHFLLYVSSTTCFTVTIGNVFVTA